MYNFLVLKTYPINECASINRKSNLNKCLQRSFDTDTVPDPDWSKQINSTKVLIN